MVLTSNKNLLSGIKLTKNGIKCKQKTKKKKKKVYFTLKLKKNK